MVGFNLQTLWDEQIMKHMHVLCKDIGPRPPASAQERQAADYVRQTLQRLGVTDIQEQIFHSQTSIGWVNITCCLIMLAGLLAAWLGGSVGKFAGGVLLIGGAFILRDYILARLPFFNPWIARGVSQNIIAHLPPAGPEKRKIYLIGHLDSQKQRFLSPPPNPSMFVDNSTLFILLPMFCGLLLFVEVLFGWHMFAWWGVPFGVILLITLLMVASEERQPHIEGANDNATAVSILLGVAEALRAKPLQNSAVTLLFTGCEEVLCVGMENYLLQFNPPKENTYWIDLEMVGTGNLCYVTRHGVSHLTHYFPAPQMVALAERTAQKYPELGVIGKEMVIVEEVANLRNRGYTAICLAGYDERGHLPNWHRLSDNLEHIEANTLSRAGRFTWALLQEMDAL